jgi:hypothetical protein
MSLDITTLDENVFRPNIVRRNIIAVLLDKKSSDKKSLDKMLLDEPAWYQFFVFFKIEHDFKLSHGRNVWPKSPKPSCAVNAAVAM